jgi:hypothetical protein
MENHRTDPQSLPRDAATLSTTEARQAITTGRVRYILAVSTVLAIVAMVVAYTVI